MKIKLLIKQKASKIIELNKAYCVIGRTSHADISLSDVQSSKQHAVIYESHEGALKIDDLDSTNGTFVNGNRVRETDLHVGDRIQIGGTVVLILEFKPVTSTNLGAEETGSIDVEKTVFAELVPKNRKSDVIKGGPDMIFRSIPLTAQDRFIDYVDDEGHRSRTALHELLQKKSHLKKVS